MSSVLCHAARSLGFAALLAGVLVLAEARPGLAQAMLDFGQPGGEDVLDGGPAAFGPQPFRSSATDMSRVESAPRPHRYEHRGRSLHALPRAANRYEHSGRSLTYVRPSYHRGTGVFANASPTGGSILAFRPFQPAAHGIERTGPKWIDVETERLDRRPIGSAGIAYHYAGTAKIIRIAPDGRQRSGKPEHAALQRESEHTVRDGGSVEGERTGAAEASVAAPAPAAPLAPAQPNGERDAAATAFFEPWSDEWLRDCEARHADFDAALGTYIDEAGLRRFCTGDPA